MDCTTSVVTHAAIVRKVYFPRAVFPLTAAATKLVEFGINWAILILLLLYWLYTANPLAGIIDSYQRALLKGAAPDPASVLPGLLVTAALLPICYRFFRRAERRFADVI